VEVIELLVAVFGVAVNLAVARPLQGSSYGSMVRAVLGVIRKN